MDLLRGFTKRAPSSPGSAAAAAGESSPAEECAPGDRLLRLSQDIFFEEERHQQAMMALESSVLGCGSDDWSVDSDYAFQDFADDVKQHQHNNTEQLIQQSSPERSPPLPGTPSSIRALGNGNPIKGNDNDLSTGSMCSVREHAGTASDTAVVTTTPAEGAGGVRGEAPLPGKVTWAAGGGENREDSTAGSGRDDPCMSNARLFGDPGSSTDSAHILRLEQRMFLKAAFQLLEERDRLFPASIGSWGAAGAVVPIVGGGGGGGSNLRDHRGAFVNGGAITARKAGEGVRFQFQHEPGLSANRPRILKSGNLRKATARSVGRLEKTTWKTKYVELTPGSFAYSDSGPSVLGKSRSAKVIPLHQGFCTCRTVKAKHRVTRSRNSVIFSNLPKPANHHHARGGRGMSSSVLGQTDAGGFGGGGGGGSSSSSKHLLEIEVVGLKRRLWAAESKQECRRWVSAIKGAMTERPVDPQETALGEDQLPIIPHDSCHRHHMESYLSARGFLRNATSTEDYLSALKGLMKAVGTGPESRQGAQQESLSSSSMGMGVPVKWVKQQLPGSERVYQTSARGRGKSELAQLWKDMKRDTVSINGRVMTGEQGPEGIIGALTRCILAQAGRLPASDSLSKLSEAQSLLAARDVLLACDRTTSGGDTYLVVDNLCRNPPLVVLVPASQEAEPLDITVTLHPRAAQAKPQAHSKPPIPTPCHGEKGRAEHGSSPSHPPAPGGALEPPSPSSPGTNSAAASLFGREPEGGRPGSAASAGPGGDDLTSPGGGDGRRGGGSSEAQQQQQQAGKGLASTAPRVAEGEAAKRRGAFKIPGGGKARLSRSGSMTPVKTPAAAAAAAAAVAARHVASWDGSQDVLPVPPVSPGPGRPSFTPGDKGGQGEATASPTGEPGRGGSVAGEGGGGGGGGGIFASLSRRRSGEAIAGRPGGDGLSLASSVKSRNVPAASSAREKGAGDRGRKPNAFGVVRGGLSSAPADTQASYKMFFGDTDDGGEESGSSDDDEDGLRPRRSFVRVSCTARTSYKLFSSDPQDEERDVFAVVTGLFEQSFTISREFPSGSGSRAGMGSATRTEGSVAFLTFNEPVLTRRSLDSSTSGPTAAEGFKVGLDPGVHPEAKERAAEPADAGAAGGASHPSPGAGIEGNDTVRINPFDDDSEDSSLDVFGGGSGLGAHTSFPCNFGDGRKPILERAGGDGSGEEEEQEGGASEKEETEASGPPADNDDNDNDNDNDNSYNANTGPPTACQPTRGAEGSRRRPGHPARKLLVREAVEANGGAAGNKGYGFGFAQKSGDGGGAAADGEFGNLAATAALTPDSVGPVPFSLESAAPRSRAGSSEPPSSLLPSSSSLLLPSSPAPASSLSNSARVERKVSRIAGLLLRRFSSRDMSDPDRDPDPDPAEALPLEPLEIDSDDEYGGA